MISFVGYTFDCKTCKELSYFILSYQLVQSLIWCFFFLLQYSVIMIILFALLAVLNFGTSVTSAHCPSALNVVKPLRIYCDLLKCHVRMQNMAAGWRVGTLSRRIMKKNASISHVIVPFQDVTLLNHQKCCLCILAINTGILKSNFLMVNPSLSPWSLMMKPFVLREENDGKLFILSNSTTLLGNAVNICCFGPDASEYDYSYDILATSQICKLKLHSFAKNVQRVTLANLSSEFLVIPLGSFEPLNLEICITCATPLVPPVSFSLLCYFPIKWLLSSFYILNLYPSIFFQILHYLKCHKRLLSFSVFG